MSNSYRFKKVSSHDELSHLKDDWIQSLTRPQDGMWAAFRSAAEHIKIRDSDQLIGYACIGQENNLLQFYVIPEYLGKGEEIFKDFIAAFNIKGGIVGTNNLTFLSIALHFCEELDIHTYLFDDHFEMPLTERDGILKECQTKDLDSIVHFCHESIGAPKEWLNGYIGGLIENGEVFSLENADNIIGTCEVRRSASAPDFADIGMIVSPDFRRQGYGSYLLNKAKSIAKEWNKTPICSCEKDNIGSLKVIQQSGFVSRYQLLAITFKYS